MKNKVIKSPVFVIITIVALVFAIGFTFFSISSTFGSLSSNLTTNPAEALLTSTELSVNSLTSIPIKYYRKAEEECVNLYDQSQKAALENRQFEWAKCDYHHGAFEQNLVQPTLNSEHLPVATGTGSLLPNRGITPNNLANWFSGNDEMPGTLALQYRANAKTFIYESDNFYPIGSQLFTMNLEIPFTTILSGSETFNLTADDDTWVFLNDNLVLDLGGIHSSMDATFTIHDNGEVYISVNHEPEHYSGVNLTAERSVKTRIFHANRNNPESVFKIAFSNMYLNIFNTEIAYNDNDPAYVPPLGETSIFEPNHNSAILTSIIAEFFILGILLMLTPVIVSFAIRHRQK